MPLLLLPNLLGFGSISDFLPPVVEAAVARIDGLIAESEGGGRSYLKRFQTKKKAHLMPIALLNKRSQPEDLNFLLEPVVAGETWGVVTDAGLPCLADPGAALVLRARQLGLPIEAYAGPSSILLALMQSGLTGQRFTFRGYIAKEPAKRIQELRQWEEQSIKEQSTQLFIEAPYRNDHTLQSCLTALRPNTLLSVASDLTMPSQFIQTLPLREWKSKPLPLLNDRPTIFLFQNLGVI